MMRLASLLRNNSKLRPWLWLVLMLLLLGAPDSLRAAQTNTWPTGQVGIRWAFWVNELAPTAKDGLLTLVSDPSGSELLLAAGTYGAVAINLEIAAEVWTYQRPQYQGYSSASAPPLVQDKILYLYNTAFDALYGRQLWQAPADYHASMLLANGVLYLVGFRDTWAVNAENGTILWHSPADVSTGSDRSRPFLLDDTLVVHYIDGQIWALDAHTGQTRWQLTEGGSDFLTATAGTIYMLEDHERDRLLALTPTTGQLLWGYPPTDAAGTYGAPRIADRARPLLDDETLYLLDIEGRVIALEAGGGSPRWISPPLLSGYSDRITFHKIGQILVAAGTNLIGLDGNTGKILWQQKPLAGPLIAIVADTILLISHDQEGINLIQAETGQLVGSLSEAASPARLNNFAYHPGAEAIAFGWETAVAEGQDDFVYFSPGDNYIYAIGPAAPGEAVAMARAFVRRGNYRSAVRTLSFLKATDGQGYLTHGGEPVAIEALNGWLDDTEALEKTEEQTNGGYVSWPEDLIYGLTRLQIRDMQARMKYIEAYRRVENFNQCQHSQCPRAVDLIREVCDLKTSYGDTVWAERLEQLLASNRKPALPRLAPGGPAYLGWWYVPFILPALVLLVSIGYSQKRKNIYQAGVTAGLACWGGLGYLLWANNRHLLFVPISEFKESTLGLDTALIAGVPLAVWLLTRSKTYALIALALSVIHRYLLYNSLLTLLSC